MTFWEGLMLVGIATVGFADKERTVWAGFALVIIACVLA